MRLLTLSDMYGHWRAAFNLAVIYEAGLPGVDQVSHGTQNSTYNPAGLSLSRTIVVHVLQSIRLEACSKAVVF